MRNDAVTCMFFSNLVMYLVIPSRPHVRPPRHCEALRPLAGAGAYWLFSLGLLGAGMFGIPVWAGSCAYAIADAEATPVFRREP